MLFWDRGFFDFYIFNDIDRFFLFSFMLDEIIVYNMEIVVGKCLFFVVFCFEFVMIILLEFIMDG